MSEGNENVTNRALTMSVCASIDEKQDTNLLKKKEKSQVQHDILKAVWSADKIVLVNIIK